ncbi:MAG: SufD family Fe-S cluster assembly protein [Nocardioides sp.]
MTSPPSTPAPAGRWRRSDCVRRRRPAHRAPALRRPHRPAHARSHVVYKGALQGEGAHAVWIGNVLIRKVAEGIDTYEENRNLVLTDGCQADSVPNLEIETGEIEGAGHASATGRLTTSSCSISARAVSRRPRLAGWWCTGSSTT